MGTTGRSTGTHLHLGVYTGAPSYSNARMIDPLTIQEVGSKTIFDEYGYPVEATVTGVGTNYTLKVTYTYKQ